MDLEKIISEKNLKTREDINNFMGDLVGGLMQKILDKEFDEHMQYEKGKHSNNINSRNGKSSSKKIRTNYGELNIDMPRDREGKFEPIVVPKRKTLLMDTADTITVMYAKGNSIKDIKELLKQIYKVEVNEDFICEATKMVNEEVKIWQERKLKEIYPFVYMDCMYVSVKEELVSVKKAVYVALGVDIQGNKEVLGFWIDNSESSSFWYGILEELKGRGVKDIIYLSSDGVSGFKEIIEESYPKTIHQRCIVHIIRNLTKCVPRKQWQELCNDLKSIYKAPNIESAKEAVKIVVKKWEGNKILSKKLDMDITHLLQLFDYPEYIKRAVYTTNPIESLNSALRKVTDGKGSFINEKALGKILFLRIKELSKTWKRRGLQNWPSILNELYLLHEDRIEKYIENS